MTNGFSFKRFGACVSAYYSRDVRGNVLKVAGFAIFVIFVYLFLSQIDWVTFWISSARTVCVVVAILIWVYTISMSFRLYFKPSTASFRFMLPASQSEKFTLAFLSNMIVVPLILALILLLNDYMWLGITHTNAIGFFRMTIADYKTWDGERVHVESLFQFKFFWRFYYVIAILYFLASVFFLGSVIFRRNQFFYTLIFCFFAGAILWTLDHNILIETQIETIKPGMPGTETIVAHSSLLPWLLVSKLWASSLSLTAIFGGIIYLAWCRFSRIQITG